MFVDKMFEYWGNFVIKINRSGIVEKTDLFPQTLFPGKSLNVNNLSNFPQFQSLYKHYYEFNIIKERSFHEISLR